MELIQLKKELLRKILNAKLTVTELHNAKAKATEILARREQPKNTR
jgi:hypothetical protein